MVAVVVYGRVGSLSSYLDDRQYDIMGQHRTDMTSALFRVVSYSEETPTVWLHICKMEDDRKLKTPMFGTVDGTNKRGRPCREWMDDTVSWCKTGLQELNSLPQDRRRWKLITRQAVDTNGRWSHGS